MSEKHPNLKRAAGIAALAAGVWMAVSPKVDENKEQTRGAVEDVFDDAGVDSGADAGVDSGADAVVNAEVSIDAATTLKVPKTDSATKSDGSLTEEYLNDLELARGALEGNYKSARMLIDRIDDMYPPWGDFQKRRKEKLHSLGIDYSIYMQMKNAVFFHDAEDELGYQSNLEDDENRIGEKKNLVGSIVTFLAAQAEKDPFSPLFLNIIDKDASDLKSFMKALFYFAEKNPCSEIDPVLIDQLKEIYD